MSRPHHRKSQSTSALSIIASGHESTLGMSMVSNGVPSNTNGLSSSSSNSPLPAFNEIIGKRRGLAAVDEVPESNERRDKGGRSKSSNREKGKERERRLDEPGPSKDRAQSVDDVKLWLGEIRSLRSSTRRRGAAVRRLERSLLDSCEGQSTGIPLSTFINLKPHESLLSLLSRHTATLTRRAPSTSLPAGDEAAIALSPEIEGACSILQGLCLLSRHTKEEVGERWVIEMFIDLLLLLRTQPPLGEAKPVTYGILDLLFCILVDRPDHARVFESVGGLEAVTRVLKGSSVAKEIRMKCIEFLYFYLLPENTGKRSTSSSSTSSDSSTSSSLYPPSPLDSSASEIPTSSKLTTPSNLNPTSTSTAAQSRSQSPILKSQWIDLDLPFVPQTPRKPAKPSLGFYTPSTRRVSTTSSSTTPILPSPASVSSGRLPRVPSSEHRESQQHHRVEAGVGLGFELPSDETTAMFSDPFARSMVRTTSSQSASTKGSGSGSASGSRTEGVSVNGGLRSTSITSVSSGGSGGSGSSSGSANSSVTAVPASSNSNLHRPPTQSGDSITNTPASSSSTSSSRIPRSSTQPSLPGVLGRGRQSSRHVSRSPLVNSITPTPESPESQVSNPDQLGSCSLVLPASERKIHHSRTQSALSALGGPSSSLPTSGSNPIQEGLGVAGRTSNRPRGFPSEITRGILPSASSSSLAGMVSSPSSSSAHVSDLSSSSSTSAPRPPFRVGMGQRNITPTPMPKAGGQNGGIMSAPTPLGPSRVVSGQRRESVSLSKGKQTAGGEKRRESSHRSHQGERSVAEKKEMLAAWLGNVDQLVQGVEKTGFWGSLDKKESG